LTEASQTSLLRSRAFAVSLDHEDFDAATTFLDDSCTYDSPVGSVQGAAEIIDSYRKNAEWAADAFDELRYESAIELQPDGTVLITYTDNTVHSGMTHKYQCQQVLTFNECGKIAHITHQEIEGQKEALEGFLKRCGIKRPQTS